MRVILIVVCAILTLFVVLTTVSYVVDETYVQWSMGNGWVNPRHRLHGPALQIFFTLCLLALLLVCAVGRIGWHLWHRQRPGWSLPIWLFILLVCAASFLP